MNSSAFKISTDKTRFNAKAIKSLLKQSYWANYRSEEIINKSIENSICYGVFKND